MSEELVLPDLNDLKYKFIVSHYDEMTDLETRNMCVSVGNGQNAILFTYLEPRNANKSVLLAGIYSIMNPYTISLLPVGMKGFENIFIPEDMQFNFIKEKEACLLQAFIVQTKIKLKEGVKDED